MPSNRSTNSLWAILLGGILLFRVLLLLRGPGGGIYNTDELIMLWSTTGLLFNATATQLVWPATLVQMLAFPVVLVQLTATHLLPAMDGGVTALIEAVNGYIASVGFRPSMLLVPLRLWITLLSVLALAAAIPPARRLFGDRVTVMLLLFAGLSPLVTQESLMFKSDGLAVALFLPLLLWTLETSVSKRRGWDLHSVALAAGMGLLVATRLTYIPFLLVLPGLLLLRHRQEAEARALALLRPGHALLLMAAGFLAALLLAFPQLWTNAPTFAKTFAGNYLGFLAGHEPDRLLLLRYSPLWVGVAALPLAVWGAVRLPANLALRGRIVFWAGAALLLLPIIISSFYYARHTLQIVPALLLLTAIGLEDVSRRLPRPAAVTVIVLVAVLTLAQTLLRHETIRRSDLTAAVSRVEQLQGTDGRIAVPFYSIARIALQPDSLTAARMDHAFRTELEAAVLARVEHHLGELDSLQRYSLAPYTTRVFGEDELIREVRYRAMHVTAKRGLAPQQGRTLYYYGRPDSPFLPPGVLTVDSVRTLAEKGELDALLLPPDYDDGLWGESREVWPADERRLWRVLTFRGTGGSGPSAELMELSP